MTDSKLAVVILAAGKGTRMASDQPKVLHELAGRPMLGHVLAAVEALDPERIVVVVGPDMDAVAEAARPHATVVQQPQLGTGHAVLMAKEALAGFHGPEGSGDVLVLYGDTPLVTADTLERMAALRRGENPPALVVLGFRTPEPGAYGRLVLDTTGHLLRIVEAADASPEEKAIDLCNGGLMLGHGPGLFDLLSRVGKDNVKGEYYLTDVVGLAEAEGLTAKVAEAPEEEIQGVNSRAELAAAEAVLQQRLRAAAMDAGATLIDPASVWLSHDTVLGRDVVVEPSVFFGPGVSVGDGARILGFCHLQGARIGPGARVGPYARFRPGTELGEGARVGNFVEVKNATLGKGAKANHLSYVGDAEIGPGANIGAGTITCNYDGFAKHRTEIGPGAFIGSNTSLVAPVKVGEGAIVGAGSTIVRDVEDDALAVARGKQESREGWAGRLRASRQRPSKK